jgi:hypothetical protein
VELITGTKQDPEIGATENDPEELRQAAENSARAEFRKACEHFAVHGQDYGSEAERQARQYLIDAAMRLYRHYGLNDLPTSDEVALLRHQLADEKFDEMQWMKDRAKLYADPDCLICHARGYVGFAMEPVLQPNRFALHGHLKIADRPTITFCSCVNWPEGEYRRLHSENMSATKTSMQVLKRLEGIENSLKELRDLGQVTLRHTALGGPRTWLVYMWRAIVEPWKQLHTEKPADAPSSEPGTKEPGRV